MNSKRIDIGIVVLHYMNTDDTIACVSSFLTKLDTPSFHIIVVDNASTNQSGEVLRTKYSNNPNVSVVLNEKNLGFSAGNNVGIDFLKENFEVNYIILSNNDICLYENALFQKIHRAYLDTHFAVMGPMIYTADGRYDSNPIFDLPYTREAALWQKRMLEARLRRYTSRLYPHNLKLHNLWKRVKRKIFRERKFDSASRRYNRPELLFTRRDHVVLHGCFLILSKEFFMKFKGLDVRTFLYAEEDILYRNMEKYNLKMLYNPGITVYHKEGNSVKYSQKEERNKVIFVTTHAIKAIDAYIKMLDEYGI